MHHRMGHKSPEAKINEDVKKFTAAYEEKKKIRKYPHVPVSAEFLRKIASNQAEHIKSLLKKNVEAGIVPADEELQRAARIDELSQQGREARSGDGAQGRTRRRTWRSPPR